jgi:ABC-type Fe3+ transport system substrate-binding protein
MVLQRVVRRVVLFAISIAFASSVGFGAFAAPDEWAKTVEAAKKEGKVVVAIPPSAKLRKQMQKQFAERFPGIELEVVSSRGSKAVKRIGDERQAGVRYFDAYVGGSSSLFTGLVRPGYADAVEDYMILDEVKDPKRWFAGHVYVDNTKKYGYTFNAYQSKNFWYNTKLLDPSKLASFDDLLDPELKGKIGFYDPRKPGAGGSTWSYLWTVKGEDYLRKLLAQEPLIIGNQRSLAEALAKGKVALTIGLTYYSFRPFVDAGLPVKPLPKVFKEGTYVSGGSGNLAVLKDPPHPNATKVFVNWMLGPEGQQVFTSAMGQPSRRLDVDTSAALKIGYIPAKEALTVEEFYKYENQSEDQLTNVRVPARKLAKKMIK